MNKLARTPAGRYTLQTLDRRLAEARMAEFLEIVRQFPAMNWTRDNLLMELPSKWDVSIAALHELGPVCGFSVNSLREQSLYVHLLLVPKSLRGQGIGAAMLARARELATNYPHINCIQLRTTISWTDALRFYQKRGFFVREELIETQQYLMELPVRDCSI